MGGDDSLLRKSLNGTNTSKDVFLDVTEGPWKVRPKSDREVQKVKRYTTEVEWEGWN